LLAVVAVADSQKAPATTGQQGLPQHELDMFIGCSLNAAAGAAVLLHMQHHPKQ